MIHLSRSKRPGLAARLLSGQPHISNHSVTRIMDIENVQLVNTNQPTVSKVFCNTNQQLGRSDCSRLTPYCKGCKSKAAADGHRQERQELMCSYWLPKKITQFVNNT